MRPPAFALAGALSPAPVARSAGIRGAMVLAFDAAGFDRGDEAPLPRKPARRDASPAARAWSWIMVGILIAALVLPFSVAALVDLTRYLAR